jgi:hypothetical protein
MLSYILVSSQETRFCFVGIWKKFAHAEYGMAQALLSCQSSFLYCVSNQSPHLKTPILCGDVMKKDFSTKLAFLLVI